MKCCGGRRRLTPIQKTGRSEAPIDFLYVGETSLTVIGGASGRRYYFDRKHCRLPVERRDAPSLSAVPLLRGLPSRAPPGPRQRPSG